MKYLIISEEGLSEACLPFLINEIERNDIRSEITVFKTRKFNKQVALDQKVDLLLHVGHLTRSVNYDSFRKRSTKVCLYFISDGTTNGLSTKAVKSFDKVFTTLPNDHEVLGLKLTDVKYVGSPIIDLLRTYEYEENFEVAGNQQCVAVLTNVKGNINPIIRFARKLSFRTPNLKFIIAADSKSSLRSVQEDAIDNLEIVYDKRFDVLKSSNAAISFDQISALEAALSNCPQIVVKKNRIKWFHTSKKPSLISRIVGREIVREFSSVEGVSEELHRILGDHEYSATILEGYQEIRERIGMEPSFRKAVRVLMEWLEED